MIEPIDFSNTQNPIELLKTASSDRKTKVLVTVFSLKMPRASQIGTQLLVSPDSLIGNEEKIPESIFNLIQKESSEIFDSQKNKISASGDHFVFLECIKAPVHLMLFGAGNDTIPLAKMADLLGWELSLIDGRSSHATAQRFPTVNHIIISTADAAVDQLVFDPYSVVLLMTHNFEYEVEVLKSLLKKDIPYIGILGPKKKRLKMIERLELEGIEANQNNLYGPMGLDIGAEGSEEIALSVLSEIKAVVSQKSSGFLRDKNGPIHDEER